MLLGGCRAEGRIAGNSHTESLLEEVGVDDRLGPFSGERSPGSRARPGVVARVDCLSGERSGERRLLISKQLLKSLTFPLLVCRLCIRLWW